MTINECLYLLSEWYKKASTYRKSNHFRSAYLMKVKEISEAVLNTTFSHDANVVYIDQKIITLKPQSIDYFDDDSTKGEKTAINDLYEITNKWRSAYYAGKLY